MTHVKQPMPEISHRNQFAPLNVPVPYIWTIDYSDWDGVTLNHYEFTQLYKAQKFINKWGGKYHMQQIMVMDTDADEARYNEVKEKEDQILDTEQPFIAEGLEKIEKAS